MEQKCETCESRLCFSWTDTHGVAQCCTCGTPYRIYHYDDNKQRIDKAPESIVSDEWKPRLRTYWGNHHRIIPSGCSCPGGQELASREDHERFNEWCVKNVPATQEAAHGA